MLNEYYLIGYRTTIGKQDYKVIDRTSEYNLETAEDRFIRRNNYEKLLKNHDLIIAKGIKFYQ